jgi:hypothetical protein
MENKKTRVCYLKQRLFESNKHYESRVNTALATISDLDNSEIIRLITNNRFVYICYIEETKVSPKIGFTSK